LTKVAIQYNGRDANPGPLNMKARALGLTTTPVSLTAVLRYMSGVLST